MVKLFRNAHIFTPKDPGYPLSGRTQGNVAEYQNGALLVQAGRIVQIGNEDQVLAKVKTRDIHWEVDCDGQCIVPGFVDSHTHMCFAKRREEEFNWRIKGASYLDILAQGGGILSSVRAVRTTELEDLFSNTNKTVIQALALGTTTVEIKSGYGLDLKNELKMLAVIGALNKKTPLDVIATFLGAHAIPEEYKADSDGFVEYIISAILPAVKKQNIARFCDVFCEKGVFSIEQSRRILQAALASGLKIKMHADEVHDLGGGRLAAQLKAVSADHLLATSISSITSMVNAGTIGVLLPVTAYSLKKNYAQARKMITAGLPLALATDCNPGSSYTESMPFAIGLGILNMDLSPAEALTAATLNGAYALSMAHRVGSLDPGKQADFLLVDGHTPAIFAYHAGVSPVTAVYKNGEKVA
jgi:imidazolonepropionase